MLLQQPPKFHSDQQKKPHRDTRVLEKHRITYQNGTFSPNPPEEQPKGIKDNLIIVVAYDQQEEQVLLAQLTKTQAIKVANKPA